MDLLPRGACSRNSYTRVTHLRSGCRKVLSSKRPFSRNRNISRGFNTLFGWKRRQYQGL